ncbi:MAG: primosomal protein N' [Haliscomenobacter sp.]|nr:primosomal protein N' [Haliscomenobacter sp.]
MPTLHPTESFAYHVQVVLPLAIAKPYTYGVPESLADAIGVGMRVEVEFGKKRRYAALVVETGVAPPEGRPAKPILSAIDETPIALPVQLKFWHWLAAYYACTVGEVMTAALPAHYKLVSETAITLGPYFEEDMAGLDDKEYLILEALTIQQELTLSQVQDILQQRTVYPIIRRMLDKKLLFLKEDLKEKYQPKRVACVRLKEPYVSQPDKLQEAFERLSRAGRQMEALLAVIQLSRQLPFLRKEDIYQAAGVDHAVVQGLVKKDILEVYDREVSRLGSYEEQVSGIDDFSDQQRQAYEDIRHAFSEKDVVLLHGATGSGKTRLYMEFIREAILRNEQVLYLLPEIALTAQIIERLRRVFGNQVAVYHSKLSNNERVELWQETLKGKPLVLGARSALFLPYQRLKWIIIDEEHDPSFKQQDPNPRYHGRDAAIYLAKLYGAKVLLGTATPSLESYYNAKQGKYGLAEMPERFGGLQMPELRLVPMKAGPSQHFSPELLEALTETLARGEQAILFQNRRGYAPAYRCPTCNWHAECIHCDVSMTYHKQSHALKCHYCNYQTKMPTACPACGNQKLVLQGFGTEKVEDELAIYFPERKIGRMDFDTVRSKNAHTRIIQDFEEGRIHILVGTQMVAKGLDFERVGLVGILSADQLLQFPDFRSAERAFQLMTQVSGRAGRKHRRGLVLIQALNLANPVLQEVLNHDFSTFYQRELQERQRFEYPPFFRLIRITLKHAKPERVNQAAEVLSTLLTPQFGHRIKGPAVPPVARIRGLYLIDFLLKMERAHPKIAQAKTAILEAASQMAQLEGLSGIRVQIDVDPA